MNIFDAIRRDHETQRTLVDLLVETEGASDGRSELFDRLRAELAAHAGAEERHFYVPLIEYDATQDNARHSVAEHHELDEFIEQLTSYEMNAPQWLITARELRERLVHHLDEEEQEVFPVAGRVLTDRMQTELGEEYANDMDRRRTS